MNVMIDIETLGVCPGCVVTEVGCCRFDGGGVTERLSVPLSFKAQSSLGLKVDADTLHWTLKHEAPLEALERSLECVDDLSETLRRLSRWMLDSLEFPTAEVWACGPDFDLRLLEVLLRRCRVRVPWDYWQARCFRTWRKTVGVQKPENRHCAVEDAVGQAELVAQWLGNHPAGRKVDVTDRGGVA